MERNYAIDFLKFFAIVAVVVIHTFPNNHELGYFVLDNFSRFAVPFFFAASGYLFGLKVINNSNSIDYFKRYLMKIIKIYLCWLLFYIVYDFIRIALSSGNLVKYFKKLTFLNLIYYGHGTSGYQLWFVISLAWSIVILYLFFWLKKINLLLILSLCLNLVGLFGQSYSTLYELETSTRDALFIGLFYTTLGFWFVYVSPFKRYQYLNKKAYFYLFCLFSALQALEGYWLEHVLNSKHGEYFISTIFLTAFLFLFAFYNPKLGKGLWITKIGANALGIYTVHVFFIDMMDLLVKSIGLEHISHNLLWNLVDILLVFTISYIAYHYLQKIKFNLFFWR